ncbi:MAG: GspE/PulE family protein [Planctomycetota bacterium]|nr:GspE/PulE family protein [Planctomycetota bacterium]
MTGVSGLRVGLALALAWTMLVSVEVTRAQAPPASPPVADQSSNAGEPQAVPVSTSVGGRSLPPFPGVFSRGNHLPHPRSVIRQGGGNYFNVFLCVPLLGLFFLWTWTCYWVDDDSQALQVRNEFWTAVIIPSGWIGFLSALCVPKLLGYPVLLLAYAVPAWLYVVERNAKVPDSAKVMTPAHLRRILRRLGFPVGGGRTAEVASGPDIQFIGKSDGRGGDDGRSRQVENSRGYMATKELVYDAIVRRSTDIHLEPKSNEIMVRMRIDGVLYAMEPFDIVVGNAVVNVCKVLGAMDITEKRRSLDGSFQAMTEGRRVDFRVATQGTNYGEKLSLRILDQSNSVSTLADLGLRNQMTDGLNDVINQPHGLLLVCGPTGAGKSTTLYAALNEIDTFQRNVITIEDPVEYRIDNVNQIEINSRAGNSFATSLRSVLRQDPDVVMIGEIRDAETANIACQAANTGHMVFSTVHANDTITALYRIIDLEVEPFMLASSLSGILAQRLVRRLCSQCKEPYKPKPEFLRKANLPAERISKFYRPPKNPETECPACGGLGYRGRIGVFELLPVNDRMREMIRDQSAMTAIRAEARKNGMLYMKEEGLRLVVRGVTSVDELLRVVK